MVGSLNEHLWLCHDSPAASRLELPGSGFCSGFAVSASVFLEFGLWFGGQESRWHCACSSAQDGITMVNLYLRIHKFRGSLVHKHATELEIKAMAIRLSAIDRAASCVSPMYIVTDLRIGVQCSPFLPRLVYQVPNLPRLMSEVSEAIIGIVQVFAAQLLVPDHELLHTGLP